MNHYLPLFDEDGLCGVLFFRWLGQQKLQMKYAV
jgi:hypothetical protein